MREKDKERMQHWLDTAKDKPKKRTIEVFVKHVGRESENQFGFCQAVDIFWAEGFPAIVNNMYTQQIFTIDERYRGPVKMVVKWMDGYWRGTLAEALPPIPDWTWVPKIDAGVFADVIHMLEEHLFKGEIK